MAEHKQTRSEPIETESVKVGSKAEPSSYAFAKDEFRQAGYHSIDAISRYLDTVNERPVMPKAAPEEVVGSLRGSLGPKGIGLKRAVEELAGQLFEHSMAMSNPLYLGLINSSPWPAAILGDLFVSAIDNNAGSSQQGPFVFSCEQEVLNGLAELLGIPHQGLILPGGSAANQHGLILARTQKFPEWSEQGPQAVEQLPRLYYAESTHFSVQRSALACGLGLQSLVPVSIDDRGAMDVEELRHLVELDRERGYAPFAISANIGTTGTGALDDLAAIQKVAKAEDLWFHIDACYGGGALLLPEFQHHQAALADADSITVDLHKWFFMPVTAAVAFSKDPQLVAEAFEVDASYIPTKEIIDPFQQGLPTSRRGTSLAVWLALRAEGWDQICVAVRRNIELTRELEVLLASAGFEVLPKGQLSICCARWNVAGCSGEAIDRLQVEISQAIQREGTAWFGTTRHQDQTWLRINMVNLYTKSSDLSKLVESLVSTAHKLQAAVELS